MAGKREPQGNRDQPVEPAVDVPAPVPLDRRSPGWSPAGVLALQRSAGNAAVARAILVRGKTKTKPDARSSEPEEEDLKPKDRFEGKSYDFNTKEGVLEHIKDWHTQLLWDYTHFMERVVVTQAAMVGATCAEPYANDLHRLLQSRRHEGLPHLLIDYLRSFSRAGH